jgi:hypothetical protein
MTKQVFMIVDKIEANGCLGFTNDMVKVKHNISRMPKDFALGFWEKHKECDKGSTVFCIVGNFICMIAIAPDISKGAMTFFDTLGDDNIALDLCSNLKSPNSKKAFMEQHSLLKDQHDETGEEIVLSSDFSHFN